MLIEAGEVRKEYPLDTITHQNHRIVDYQLMGTRLAVIPEKEKKQMRRPRKASPPFTDIGRGLTGSKKEKVWDVAYDLYRYHCYDIITAALKQVNLQDLLRHPSMEGETVVSLEKLHNSFETVSKISRNINHTFNQNVVIDFRFLSKFTTIHGNTIELVVPVMVKLGEETYHWSAFRPEFLIGGGD